MYYIHRLFEMQIILKEVVEFINAPQNEGTNANYDSFIRQLIQYYNNKCLDTTKTV